MKTNERVAIVGTGIAGLAAAWHLQDRCEVTMFDGNRHIGGHANTVTVRQHDRELSRPQDGELSRPQDGELSRPQDGELSLDTGFMVFNEATYPGLTKLFRELEVETVPTSMSFGVQHRASGIEYCGSSAAQLFAQPRNVLRPRFLRFLATVARFNREAHEALASHRWEQHTLDSYAASRGYGEDFLRLYLLPMAGAVWSTPFDRARLFPVMTLLRFFRNHRLLDGMNGHHSWLTIRGGARTYVEKLTRRFRDRIHLGQAVVRVDGDGTLRLAGGASARFDRVILACHADEALALLDSPTGEQRRILTPFRYQKNIATLHTDTSVMPRARRAWASWNVRVDEHDAAATTIYWMNSLQHVSDRENYFVSIDDPGLVAPERVLRTIVYHHPIFDQAAIDMQRELPRLNAASPSQTTFFCGSYFGYGFHEDGYRAGSDAAAAVLDAMRRRRDAAA